MVKRCLDRRSQPELLRPEMKESRQEHRRKAKGNLSALKGSKENAINAKGQCTKGDTCSFRHDENRRGKSTRPSTPAPEPQTKSDGKNSLEGKALRCRSASGMRYRRPCKHYISGNCLNPSCDSWHVPVCQNCRTESGCKLCESVLLCTEVGSERNLKNRRRVVAKDPLPC